MIKILFFVNSWLSVNSIIFLHSEYSQNFGIVSLIIFFLNLYYFKRNVIMLIRLVFLCGPGALVNVTKLIDQNGRFGFHLVQSQSLETSHIVLILTNLAMYGAFLGYCVVSQIKMKRQDVVKTEINVPTKIFFYFSTLCLCSYLLMKTRGANIFVQEYGTNQENFNSGFGNLNSIAIISLAAIFFYTKNIISNKKGKMQAKIYMSFCYMTIAFFIFYVCLAHGARLDALNAILAIFILSRILNNKPLSLTNLQIISGVLMVLGLQIVGVFRASLAKINVSDLISILHKLFTNLQKNPETGIIFYQGTINDISTGISGIVYMLSNGKLSFLFGSSYIDYIERIPPSFVHPDRPKDLAWTFSDNGYTSGGGFHEIAEAYYNFGVLGSFMVPFIITTIIFYSIRIFYIKSDSFFQNLVLLGILSVLVRGLFYQSFAFFKAIITAYILWFICHSFVSFLKELSPQRVKKS